uniref:Uncharacterized protein n=1 Tax=Noctiluca scintillans TaxID=2966 RepID=A0A7S0ZYP2_NOCSC|mmetsp:Transcript_2410/g.6998  ORF Transcript_2410/g.6998 Transcript_2410/m.6998 type:complete len:403 (+) Transcript_2410:136-1344(+)
MQDMFVKVALHDQCTASDSSATIGSVVSPGSHASEALEQRTEDLDDNRTMKQQPVHHTSTIVQCVSPERGDVGAGNAGHLRGDFSHSSFAGDVDIGLSQASSATQPHRSEHDREQRERELRELEHELSLQEQQLSELVKERAKDCPEAVKIHRGHSLVSCVITALREKLDRVPEAVNSSREMEEVAEGSESTCEAACDVAEGSESTCTKPVCEEPTACSPRAAPSAKDADAGSAVCSDVRSKGSQAPPVRVGGRSLVAGNTRHQPPQRLASDSAVNMALTPPCPGWASVPYSRTSRVPLTPKDCRSLQVPVQVTQSGPSSQIRIEPPVCIVRRPRSTSPFGHGMSTLRTCPPPVTLHSVDVTRASTDLEGATVPRVFPTRSTPNPGNILPLIACRLPTLASV